MKGRRLLSAEIVAVGTEILLGSLVDTNTAWLSRRLAALGVAVYRHTTVGDNKERLVAALSEAAIRADLVVSTGGLGPTADDITHEALGLATKRDMVEYPQAKRHIDQTFERFSGRRPPPSAYKQTLFPDGCELLANPLGTAMGALLELESTLFATLPGVPSEMKKDVRADAGASDREAERRRDRLPAASLRWNQRGRDVREGQRPPELPGSHGRLFGRSGRGRSG